MRGMRRLTCTRNRRSLECMRSRKMKRLKCLRSRKMKRLECKRNRKTKRLDGMRNRKMKRLKCKRNRKVSRPLKCILQNCLYKNVLLSGLYPMDYSNNLVFQLHLNLSS
jgi:hypothetical protein